MTDKHERVWDIVEKVGVCMLTTRFDGGLRARPVEARPDREARPDLVRHRPAQRQGARDRGRARRRPGVHRSEAKAYLSITARAEVLRDHAQGGSDLEEHRQRVVGRARTIRTSACCA